MAVKIILGTVAGAGFGYLLFRLIGCSTGHCLITRNPWTSMLYGAVLGLLLALRW